MEHIVFLGSVKGIKDGKVPFYSLYTYFKRKLDIMEISSSIKVDNDYNECISGEYEIAENIIFNKDQILNLLFDMGNEYGIKPKDLFLKSVIFDRNGNIIYLSLSVNGKFSNALGWKSMRLAYVIKGLNKERGLGSLSTCIRPIYLPHHGTLIYQNFKVYNGSEWVYEFNSEIKGMS